VRDITGVYDGIAALAFRFAAIALITVVLSAGVTVFFVRRLLRPLEGLRKSAAALADGQYDNRIKVTGRDEIAELSANFNQMADAVGGHIRALQDTAEQRKLLLAALTHELKTPMTAIIGYSEALMRVRLNKTQQEESIACIHSECKRIERLSQKMMRLITLHNGEAADMQPQPAKKLFEAVEMTLEGISQKENIKLVFAEKGSPVFRMDIDMMASVILNLFDNARKAGAKHIRIEAETNAISVKDDGSGIPQDEIDKVIFPFYMVDKSHSRSERGSGLGLALCELIAKEHGAHLHIESRVGEGTAVTVRFEKLHFDDNLKNT
jgi:two-component system phosphate regulon sensor histidine kinase PhoR